MACLAAITTNHTRDPQCIAFVFLYFEFVLLHHHQSRRRPAVLMHCNIMMIMITILCSVIFPFTCVEIKYEVTTVIEWKHSSTKNALLTFSKNWSKIKIKIENASLTSSIFFLPLNTKPGVIESEKRLLRNWAADLFIYLYGFISLYDIQFHLRLSSTASAHSNDVSHFQSISISGSKAKTLSAS